MIESQSAFNFQMTKDWLDRLTLLQTSPDKSDILALLFRDVNRAFYLIMTALAAIQKHLLDAQST